MGSLASAEPYARISELEAENARLREALDKSACRMFALATLPGFEKDPGGLIKQWAVEAKRAADPSRELAPVAQPPSRVPWDVDSFPAIWETDGVPPRPVKLLGTAAVDPDVWVAEIPDMQGVVWVVKGSGHVCHQGDEKISARPAAKESAGE